MEIRVGNKYVGKFTNIKVQVKEINGRRVTYERVNIPRTRHTTSLRDFMIKFKPEQAHQRGAAVRLAELFHRQKVVGSNPTPATMTERYVVKKALWDWGVWDTKKKKWVFRGNLDHNEAKERV